ncbi:hypothetical protein Z043-116363 [Arapaima gigas]
MGCTPSASGATYRPDLDTCSTVVASLRSSQWTPEGPPARPSVETDGGKRTFLAVPSRNWPGGAPTRVDAPDVGSSLSPAVSASASPARTPPAGHGTGGSDGDIDGDTWEAREKGTR